MATQIDPSLVVQQPDQADKERVALGVEARRISAAAAVLTSQILGAVLEQRKKAEELLRDLTILESKWTRKFGTTYCGSPGVRYLQVWLDRLEEALRRGPLP